MHPFRFGLCGILLHIEQRVSPFGPCQIVPDIIHGFLTMYRLKRRSVLISTPIADCLGEVYLRVFLHKVRGPPRG